MSRPISIVIICYNEEDHIGSCIKSVIGISDDIIVIDSGSTDCTVDIIQTLPVRLIETEWKGYGATKNYGHELAKYDWILSIDSDEVLSGELKQAIYACPLSDQITYQMCRINHIGHRAIKYGHLHPEQKIRLYNKHQLKWDQKKVHEELIPKSASTRHQMLSGNLIHYQAKDVGELKKKYEQYAHLSRDVRKSKLIKKVAPLFHFIRSYILFGGFLEGALGYELAKAAYYYSYKKSQDYSTNLSDHSE